jgi:L-threonylcarbamoyladenylate synthase
LPSTQLIAQAAAILRRGGLIAFPTETVYGLGADASNDAAVAKIYRVKGRPAAHPVIVHVGNAGQMLLWARDIPESARKLAEKFWPGPLTLVLKRSPAVHDSVTGGQDSIGLRVPNHPVALALLHVFGGGIAAPSANKFGRISPTTAEHVRADLGAAVDLILDGGPCEVGIESTIVDLSRGDPVLLRPGKIAPDEIAAVIGAEPARPDGLAPRAPGTLATHYAPLKPLRLVHPEELRRAVQESAGDCAFLAFGSAPAGSRPQAWIRAPADAAGYAHDLYAHLRALDASAAKLILVEHPREEVDWVPIVDRLRRAASREDSDSP